MTADLVTAEASDFGTTATSAEAVPWWSFGKTVLAAAALTLVDQGRLTLDDPRPPHDVTLRQVLQHRAGLPDYGDLPEYHAEVARHHPAWSPTDMFSRLDLRVASASTFRYSNVGYTLARSWIESATATPLETALSTLVLRPLGIDGVRLAKTLADTRDIWGIRPGYDPAWVYPGLLVGPAASAVLFLHRLLAGRLLAPATLAAMRHALPIGDRVPGRPWCSAAYGMGLMIAGTDHPAILTGHTGGGPGSVCAIYQAHPCRTVAAFARDDHPAQVELEAVALALKAA